MSSRKNRIILISSIVGMMVMVVIIIITVVHVMTKDDKPKVATKDVFSSPSAQELDALSRVTAYNVPKSYLVTFKLSADGTPTKLESIKQYRRVPNKLNPPLGQYLINIKDGNGIGYSTNFSVTAVTNEPTQDGAMQTTPTATTPTSYSVFVPWMPESSKYTVKDSTGKTLLKGIIDNVQVRDR